MIRHNSSLPNHFLGAKLQAREILEAGSPHLSPLSGEPSAPLWGKAPTPHSQRNYSKTPLTPLDLFCLFVPPSRESLWQASASRAWCSPPDSSSRPPRGRDSWDHCRGRGISGRAGPCRGDSLSNWKQTASGAPLFTVYTNTSLSAQLLKDPELCAGTLFPTEVWRALHHTREVDKARAWCLVI